MFNDFVEEGFMHLSGSEDYAELGANLAEGLAQVEQGLSDALKYPSQLQEARGTTYRTVLTMLLESGMPIELADPVRDFLASFDQALAHRRLVQTWQHNQYWFAAGFSDRGLAAGPCGNEEAALEKLYALYPELR